MSFKQARTDPAFLDHKGYNMDTPNKYQDIRLWITPGMSKAHGK